MIFFHKKPIIKYWPGYKLPAVNRRHKLKELLKGIAVMTAILGTFFFVAVI